MEPVTAIMRFATPPARTPYASSLATAGSSSPRAHLEMSMTAGSNTIIIIPRGVRGVYNR